MDITAFLGVAPCSPVDMHRRFGETCIHNEGTCIMKNVIECLSETCTHIYETVRRHTPEDNNIHFICCTKPRSHSLLKLRKTGTIVNSKIICDKFHLLLIFIDGISCSGINHWILHLLIPYMLLTVYLIQQILWRIGEKQSQLRSFKNVFLQIMNSALKHRIRVYVLSYHSDRFADGISCSKFLHIPTLKVYGVWQHERKLVLLPMFDKSSRFHQ